MDWLLHSVDSIYDMDWLLHSVDSIYDMNWLLHSVDYLWHELFVTQCRLYLCMRSAFLHILSQI